MNDIQIKNLLILLSEERGTTLEDEEFISWVAKEISATEEDLDKVINPDKYVNYEDDCINKMDLIIDTIEAMYGDRIDIPEEELRNASLIKRVEEFFDANMHQAESDRESSNLRLSFYAYSDDACLQRAIIVAVRELYGEDAILEV